MECHWFGIARERFSSRSANLRIKQKTSAIGAYQSANPCRLAKGPAGGGFWTRNDWEQRDDSRQGTTVVNLPE
ncbi:MAG: hypothetical protein DMG76_27880 [Acidobacteria bacterium]|nr:MAG: hypothetical protein DMG76_27880 [Acidobacteriota bacterium]